MALIQSCSDYRQASNLLQPTVRFLRSNVSRCELVKGLKPGAQNDDATSLGLEMILDGCLRVAPRQSGSDQPLAEGWNPVGIRSTKTQTSKQYNSE
jgi:hypothetical protein